VSEVGEYHGQLVARLCALLGPDLVGVYAGGSVALGGYLAGRSDLDVAVVCRSTLTETQKEGIVDALRHESLPCPARGLELVVYTDSTVRSGTGEPAYELNLNTGRGMPFVLSFAPEGEPHWYAIDRAIVHAHGVALAGPPPEALFAPIPRHVLLGRVCESVRWYAEHTWAGADNAVLNACRAWRYAREGTWSSKSDAGEWALERTDDRALVADALAARTDGRPLDRERVQTLLGSVLDLLQAARDEPSHS
jgi:hypothetical protein